MPDNQQIDIIPEFIVEDRVDAVFSQLDQFSVRLERDPTVLGPSYVHEKLKECRDHSISVEGLLIEFYDVERRVKNLLAARTQAYKAERSELLVLDDEVKKGKSQADREAIADFKLKQVIADIRDLKEQNVNVQYVLRAIELKKEGLNRTNNDVKKQVALMEFAKSNSNPLATDDDEFDTGAPPVSQKSTPEGTGQDIDSLFDVGDVDGTASSVENHVDNPPDDIPEEVARHMTPEGEQDPVPETEPEEDVTSFLDDISVETEDLGADDSNLDLGLDDAGDEIDELDLADLFSGNEPLDEKAVQDQPKIPASDDNVVDIGAFLSQQ